MKVKFKLKVCWEVFQCVFNKCTDVTFQSFVPIIIIKQAARLFVFNVKNKEISSCLCF